MRRKGGTGGRGAGRERENLDKIFIERKGESDGNRKEGGGGKKEDGERSIQFKGERQKE